MNLKQIIVTIIFISNNLCVTAQNHSTIRMDTALVRVNNLIIEYCNFIHNTSPKTILDHQNMIEKIFHTTPYFNKIVNSQLPHIQKQYTDFYTILNNGCLQKKKTTQIIEMPKPNITVISIVTKEEKAPTIPIKTEKYGSAELSTESPGCIKLRTPQSKTDIEKDLLNDFPTKNNESKQIKHMDDVLKKQEANLPKKASPSESTNNPDLYKKTTVIENKPNYNSGKCDLMKQKHITIINNLIRNQKKAQTGDMSALEEGLKIQEELQRWSIEALRLIDNGEISEKCVNDINQEGINLIME